MDLEVQLKGGASRSRNGARNFPLLLPFPCGEKKAIASLVQWIKDRVIQLFKVESLLTAEEIKHAKYCPFEKKVIHLLKQCCSLRRILSDKY